MNCTSKIAQNQPNFGYRIFVTLWGRLEAIVNGQLPYICPQDARGASRLPPLRTATEDMGFEKLYP